MSWGDFSSCYKLNFYSEATLCIFWFHHVMRFILCDNVRKKCLLAWVLKGQLSLRIRAHIYSFFGEKGLNRNTFLKNSTKWINHMELSFPMLFKFFEHIKTHPHPVNISESKLCLPSFHAGIKRIRHITTKTKNQAGWSYKWPEI